MERLSSLVARKLSCWK